MAIVCFVIGAVLLLGFMAGGFAVAGFLTSKMMYMVNFGLDKLPNETAAYWVVFGIFTLIGLLFFLNWLFLGMNCRKIKKLARRRKKHAEQQ